MVYKIEKAPLNSYNYFIDFDDGKRIIMTTPAKNLLNKQRIASSSLLNKEGEKMDKENFFDSIKAFMDKLNISAVFLVREHGRLVLEPIFLKA